MAQTPKRLRWSDAVRDWHSRDQEMPAEGVNNGQINPIIHGKIVSINDFVARMGGAAPCCMDRGCGRTEPDPCSGSCDADILWASEVQHAVQHVGGVATSIA